MKITELTAAQQTTIDSSSFLKPIMYFVHLVWTFIIVTKSRVHSFLPFIFKNQDGVSSGIWTAALKPGQKLKIGD
jgi:hypothetical protein